MKRYRTQLPPLDTLIFFECALRWGSFTKAADELLVSQAAVSKRIRQLEQWLGVDLFSRDAQKLRPTQAGLLLGEKVVSVLDFLLIALNQIQMPPDPVVRIGATMGIGTFWLQPRLQKFSFNNLSCTYSLTLAVTAHNFFDGDYDLLVLYGDGKIPGWATCKIIDKELVPMVSPSLAEQVMKNPGCVPLLDYRCRSPEWINWSVWKRQRKTDIFNDWPVTLCQLCAFNWPGTGWQGYCSGQSPDAQFSHGDKCPYPAAYPQFANGVWLFFSATGRCLCQRKHQGSLGSLNFVKKNL